MIFTLVGVAEEVVIASETRAGRGDEAGGLRPPPPFLRLGEIPTRCGEKSEPVERLERYRAFRIPQSTVFKQRFRDVQVSLGGISIAPVAGSGGSLRRLSLPCAPSFVPARPLGLPGPVDRGRSGSMRASRAGRCAASPPKARLGPRPRRIGVSA